MKNRLIERLKTFDSSLTVEEVIKKIKEEQKAKIKAENTLKEDIVKKCIGNYFKRVGSVGIEGETNYYYIEGIKSFEKNINDETIIKFKGENIHCNSCYGLSIINMSTYQYARVLFLNEIEEFQQITEEEYNRIKNEVEDIQKKTSILAMGEF